MTPEEFIKRLKNYKYHSCNAETCHDMLCANLDSEDREELEADYECNKSAADMIEAELINAYKNMYLK